MRAVQRGVVGWLGELVRAGGEAGISSTVYCTWRTALATLHCTCRMPKRARDHTGLGPAVLSASNEHSICASIGAAGTPNRPPTPLARSHLFEPVNVVLREAVELAVAALG